MPEEALSISDAGFRQFADALPVMIWQRDATGSVVFANRAWHTFTGITAHAGTYDIAEWAHIIHPDDLERSLAALDDAIAGRQGYSFDIRLRPGDPPNAGYRWLRTFGTPQFADGEFLGWIGYLADIHDAREHLESERLLREAATRREQEFKAIGEALPQIMWTATATGDVDWYNHRWYDYTGQTREEALGWGWQAVQYPEDFPIMMQWWTETLRAGARSEFEFRLRGRDGKFRWFLTLVNPLYDERGTIVRWFGTNTDIDEQKRSSERSKRVAQTLQEVFLPEQLPHSDLLRFDAVYVPAESDAFVGGDWYDAFALDERRFVVSIGDVAGHGLEAAVIAGRLRQTIFAAALDTPDPAAVLKIADRVLRAQTDTIATALVAFVDAEVGVVTFASAGHPTPIVVEKGGNTHSLGDGSPPLGTGGLVGDFAADSHTFTLTPDAVLLLYTDGITEFDRDIVGRSKRLVQAVSAIARDEMAFSARALLARVIDGHTTSDDTALLLLCWKPSKSITVPLDDTLTKQWRFHSSHARSAQTSRHELMTFLRRHAAIEEDLFATEIILGELLANTVEHAPGLVEIVIDWSAEAPFLTMRDAGAGFVADDAQLPHSEFSEDGRGLYLIRSLSTHVAVRPAPGFGTEIDVELPIRRAQTRPKKSC